METIIPTLSDFEELLIFLPVLSSESFEPIIEWKGGQKIEGNVNFMRWPLYEPIVTDFLEVASKECWNDYHFNHYQMGKMLKNEIVLQCADLTQIKQMLSYCVRGDKFMSEGHMGTMIREGHVGRLLQRVEQIKSSVES